MNTNNEQDNGNGVADTQNSQESVLLTPRQQEPGMTNIPFAQATAIASQLSQQSTEKRTTRWDVRTPTDKQSGGGSGNEGDNIASSSAITGEALLQALLQQLSSRSVYQHRPDLEDLQEVTVRGSVDRVISEQVPEDIIKRGDYLKKTAIKFAANGSGIRLNCVDERMLSVSQGKTFENETPIYREPLLGHGSL